MFLEDLLNRRFILSVIEGPLRTYKSLARVHGGKFDKDINIYNEHKVTKLKMFGQTITL